MGIFLHILINIILPIAVLIGIGFVFQKKFQVDVRAFTKLFINVLVPAVIFTKIYEAKVSWEFFVKVFLYVVILQVCMMLIAELISRMLKYPRGMKSAFSNTLMIFNSGNFGIPLIDLVFKSNPLALTSQLFILVIQNITSNTIGIFQASASNSSRKEALLNMFKMPVLYSILIVGLIKIAGIRMPDPILVPLSYISNAFVAIALITLGIQLAEIKAGAGMKDVLLASAIRLLFSPILGLAAVWILGFSGLVAQTLIIGVSTPTAVNTVIIAKEFENEPEYVAQIVLVTTLLSAFTLPVVIYLTMTYL